MSTNVQPALINNPGEIEASVYENELRETRRVILLVAMTVTVVALAILLSSGPHQFSKIAFGECLPVTVTTAAMDVAMLMTLCITSVKLHQISQARQDQANEEAVRKLFKSSNPQTKSAQNYVWTRPIVTLTPTPSQEAHATSTVQQNPQESAPTPAPSTVIQPPTAIVSKEPLPPADLNIEQFYTQYIEPLLRAYKGLLKAFIWAEWACEPSKREKSEVEKQLSHFEKGFGVIEENLCQCLGIDLQAHHYDSTRCVTEFVALSFNPRPPFGMGLRFPEGDLYQWVMASNLTHKERIRETFVLQFEELFPANASLIKLQALFAESQVMNAHFVAQIIEEIQTGLAPLQGENQRFALALLKAFREEAPSLIQRPSVQRALLDLKLHREDAYQCRRALRSLVDVMSRGLSKTFVKSECQAEFRASFPLTDLAVFRALTAEHRNLPEIIGLLRNTYLPLIQSQAKRETMTQWLTHCSDQAGSLVNQKKVKSALQAFQGDLGDDSALRAKIWTLGEEMTKALSLSFVQDEYLLQLRESRRLDELRELRELCSTPFELSEESFGAFLDTLQGALLSVGDQGRKKVISDVLDHFRGKARDIVANQEVRAQFLKLAKVANKSLAFQKELAALLKKLGPFLSQEFAENQAKKIIRAVIEMETVHNQAKRCSSLSIEEVLKVAVDQMQIILPKLDNLSELLTVMDDQLIKLELLLVGADPSDQETFDWAKALLVKESNMNSTRFKNDLPRLALVLLPEALQETDYRTLIGRAIHANGSLQASPVAQECFDYFIRCWGEKKGEKLIKELEKMKEEITVNGKKRFAIWVPTSRLNWIALDKNAALKVIIGFISNHTGNSSPTFIKEAAYKGKWIPLFDGVVKPIFDWLKTFPLIAPYVDNVMEQLWEGLALPLLAGSLKPYFKPVFRQVFLQGIERSMKKLAVVAAQKGNQLTLADLMPILVTDTNAMTEQLKKTISEQT